MKDCGKGCYQRINLDYQFLKRKEEIWYFERNNKEKR
jgi:hypothetical protein